MRHWMVRITVGEETPQLSLPFEDNTGYLIHYAGDDSDSVYLSIEKSLGKRYNTTVFPTIEREVNVNRQQ